MNQPILNSDIMMKNYHQSLNLDAKKKNRELRDQIEHSFYVYHINDKIEVHPLIDPLWHQ